MMVNTKEEDDLEEDDLEEDICQTCGEFKYDCICNEEFSDPEFEDNELE